MSENGGKCAKKTLTRQDIEEGRWRMVDLMMHLASLLLLLLLLLPLAFFFFLPFLIAHFRGPFLFIVSPSLSLSLFRLLKVLIYCLLTGVGRRGERRGEKKRSSSAMAAVALALPLLSPRPLRWSGRHPISFLRETSRIGCVEDGREEDRDWMDGEEERERGPRGRREGDEIKQPSHHNE